MKKQTNKKRFVPLKNHTGIRKDLFTEKFIARKYVNKKEYSESFTKLSDAINWRRNFHPLLTNTKMSQSANEFGPELFKKVQARPNGVDERFTFAQVWELYKKQHFPTLEPQSVEDREKYAKYFFPELMHLKMTEFTPELLDAFMEKKVSDAKELRTARRKNFDNDLKCLKALLNWYRENYDGMFVVPILKRHYIAGIIKKTPKRNQRKMNLEQVKLFFKSFDNEFWRDFAEFHFYMAARSQEVVGLQWESVDFDKGLITVCDVAIFGENKRFTRLKEVPKNGSERIVALNSRMHEILKRRNFLKSKKKCEFTRESTGERLSFVFEIEGQPVSYRAVQYNYNKALKKAGLYPQFSSTHILRKAMANIVRQEMGLDAAQAAGGWKSREIVEKIYSDVPSDLNKKAVDHIEKLVIGSNQSEVTNSFKLKLVKKN